MSEWYSEMKSRMKSGGFTMNEVVKFLRENPVQYLATVGRDGKAKCRPFISRIVAMSFCEPRS